jgi:hypothetical protein
MCCFSVITPVGFFARLLPPKVRVSKTQIFARAIDATRQVLVYSMNLAIAGEVAMVLPIPVAAGFGDSALQFIDLDGHANYFDRLAALFDVPVPRAKGGPRFARALRTHLVVHDVGAFVASFVPSREDFDRVDPRFRLPKVLFDRVQHYADYGFAVFQLKPGNVTVHPMAMSFVSRDPARLFFPTVHVHDGRMQPDARFDHSLYYQAARGEAPPSDGRSLAPAGWDGKGTIDATASVYRRQMQGRFPNEDVWIDSLA